MTDPHTPSGSQPSRRSSPIAADIIAANKALDIAFRGDTSSIDADMVQLFADHRAGLVEALESIIENAVDAFVFSRMIWSSLNEDALKASQSALADKIDKARAAIAKTGAAE